MATEVSVRKAFGGAGSGLGGFLFTILRRRIGFEGAE